MSVEIYELEDAAHIEEKLVEALERKQELQRELTLKLKRTLVLRRWLANHDERVVERTLGNPMKGPLKTHWTGGVRQGWTFSVSRPGFPDTVQFDGRTLPTQMRSTFAQSVVAQSDLGYGDAKDRLIADLADSLRLDRKILRTATYQNRKENPR